MERYSVIHKVAFSGECYNIYEHCSPTGEKQEPELIASCANKIIAEFICELLNNNSAQC